MHDDVGGAEGRVIAWNQRCRKQMRPVQSQARASFTSAARARTNPPKSAGEMVFSSTKIASVPASFLRPTLEQGRDGSSVIDHQREPLYGGMALKASRIDNSGASSLKCSKLTASAQAC